MSKYCEMAFNGAIIGFTNPQIRAAAFALQNDKTMKLTAGQFKELLDEHGISSTHPMTSSMNTRDAQQSRFFNEWPILALHSTRSI